MNRDFLRFLRYNLKHYSLALWGIRQQLEPDYPKVEKFFPYLISDSVYEYRTYGAMLLWGIAVVSLLPSWLVGFLIGFWGACAYIRSGYFRSNYLFWKQAYREAPAKPRIKGFYMEWIIREVLWRMQHGHSSKDVEPLDKLAFQIQEEICRLPSYTDAYECGAGAGGIGSADRDRGTPAPGDGSNAGRPPRSIPASEFRRRVEAGESRVKNDSE